MLERWIELGMERKLALEIQLAIEDRNRARRARMTWRREIDYWRKQGTAVRCEAGVRPG